MTPPPKWGGGVEKCPRCDKSVYHAEKVLGPNQTAWHKQCFSCKECRRWLDSATLANRDNEIYCKPCHSKLFGPKGYGYAAGAGGLAPQ